MLTGLACLNGKQILGHLPLGLAGGVATLLAFLPSWMAAAKLTSSWSILFPSRFSASDNKGLIAAVLVCLSAMGWTRIADGDRPRLVPGALAAVLLAGLVLAPQTSPVPPTRYPWLVAILVVAATCLVLLGGRLGTRLLLGGLVLLTVAEGARIVVEMDRMPESSPWSVPASTFPERALHDTQARHLRDQLDDPPRSRPARTPESAPDMAIYGGQVADASGFLGATFSLGDYGGFMTTARRNIIEDPRLRELMLQPWGAWLFSCEEVDCSQDRIALPDMTGRHSDRVTTTSYGLSTISYEVSLPQRSLMIENEIFARGWRAGRTDIRPVSVDGTLRGWILPAGEYEFSATYVLPERPAQLGLGLLALISLAGAIGFYRRARAS